MRHLIEPLVLRGVTVPDRIVMGPMSGYSDLPFRRICVEEGARALFSEMIKARALVFGNRRTRERFISRAGEELFAVQLLGRDPDDMAGAAVVLSQEEGLPWIDINMGCPVRKVVAECAGAMLMQDLPAAERVVRAVRAVHGGLLSVKMRLGWSPGAKNVLDLARLVESCGADLVTVHGRTREEWYSGPVDYDSIARVKGALSIPVFGNGGLMSAQKVQEMVERTGVDGVMIARGAFGNPWLFSQVAHLAREGRPAPAVPLSVRREVFFRHMRYLDDYYGEERAVPLVRKMAVFYFKGIANVTTMRRMVYDAKSLATVRSIVEECCADGTFEHGAEGRDVDGSAVAKSGFSDKL